MSFAGYSAILSPVLTTRDTNLLNFLKNQNIWARESQAGKSSFFDGNAIVKDSMSGLYIDPRMEEITFVTPESWIFHTVSYSAVCKFSVVCTASLKVFGTEFVRELVLLYSRFLHLSAGFQEDHDCMMLLEYMDNGFRQAVTCEGKSVVMQGFASDSYYLDKSKTVDFYSHFAEEFKKITLHALVDEDSEELCVLRTHQEGFYFNSLPSFESGTPDRGIKKFRELVCRQEFLRLFSLFNAPVCTTHDIGLFHRLKKFIDEELGVAQQLRTRIKTHSDDKTYLIPFCASRKFVLRRDGKISDPVRTSIESSDAAVAASSTLPSEPTDKIDLSEPSAPSPPNIDAPSSKKKDKKEEKEEKEEEGGGCLVM